jgi:hypothetical protein
MVEDGLRYLNAKISKFSLLSKLWAAFLLGSAIKGEHSNRPPEAFKPFAQTKQAVCLRHSSRLPSVFKPFAFGVRPIFAATFLQQTDECITFAMMNRHPE